MNSLSSFEKFPSTGCKFSDPAAEKIVVGWLCAGHGLDKIRASKPEIHADWFSIFGKVFSAAEAIERRGQNVNNYSLSEYLGNLGQLSDIGGPAAIVPGHDIWLVVEDRLNKLHKLYRERSVHELGRKMRAGMTPDEAIKLLLPLAWEYGGGASKLPSGKSILDFAVNPPDENDTLLGERWLCRKGAALFVGPSGIGKSSASCQQDILWGIGREAFGIIPKRPLRILTIQAENDDGDLYEMSSGVLKGLFLTAEEHELIRRNVTYFRVAGRTSLGFLREVVRPLMEKHKPDLVRLDPFQAYFGRDISKAEEIAEFCRSGLNPLLDEFGCGAIINHHTPKTNNRDTSGWRPSDWMYAGAGSADMTNWARAILAIDPTMNPAVFKFIAAKRGSRLQWRDKELNLTNTRCFAHKTDCMAWREATEEEANEAMKSMKSTAPEKKAEDLLRLIPMAPGTIGLNTLEAKASSLGISQKKFRTLRGELVETGKAFEHRIPRPGTRAEIRLARYEPSLI